MLSRKFNRVGIVANILLSICLIVISIFVIIYRQQIIDQITVWRFSPSAEITMLVDRSGMNDNGKFYYYASQPRLESTQSFNLLCDSVENTTSILGCYNNYRIYIYNIADEQLDGIKEVTATHEALHAVFQRLSEGEKAEIQGLLEAEYTKIQNNKEYSDKMSFYARAEPGERDNELHSVIGTEIADISPTLEAYYSRYFSDRQKVVALNAKFSSVFRNLKIRANELSIQLTDLDAIIAKDSTDYNNNVQVLNADINAFNLLASNGGFESQEQFNSQRYALTLRVSALGSLRTTISNNIAKYDLVLAEYNSIASESKKLYNSIDSKLAPAPSV